MLDLHSYLVVEQADPADHGVPLYGGRLPGAVWSAQSVSGADFAAGGGHYAHHLLRGLPAHLHHRRRVPVGGTGGGSAGGVGFHPASPAGKYGKSNQLAVEHRDAAGVLSAVSGIHLL